MNITIHRGTHQIGGCITEISTDGCRILIDLGSNLPGTDSKEFTEADIERITKGVDAIFYTHAHSDHTGLGHLVDSSIPQYIGEGAKQVLLCKFKALSKHDKCEQELQAAERMLTYKALDRIDVAGKGKIVVTPYYVSHSVFDAYMFKIECEGKTILHTGDFRTNGYLGKGLPKVLKAYIRQVDVLIIEGTMLSRNDEEVIHEKDIYTNTKQALQQHKYIFALCSSTDIDRLASFHKACRDEGKTMLVDPYQSNLFDIFDTCGVRKTKDGKLYDFKTGLYHYHRRSAEEVLNRLGGRGFLMPIRVSMIDDVKELTKYCKEEEPWLIYSMWNGYAEEGKPYTIPKIIELRKLFGNRILDGTKAGFHTSGHADKETIQEVIDFVKPRLGIIPIHKDKNSDFKDLPAANQYHIIDHSEVVGNVNVVIK